MLNGQPISCIQRPETGRELTFSHLSPASKKKIFVIGGGPAGMKATAVAASRAFGKLIEATSKLGGQVNLAERLPGRSEFGGIKTNLENMLRTQDVEIKLNTEASLQLIRRAPEVIILATGGKSFEPKIEGKECAHVVTAWQLLGAKLM